MFLIKLSFLEPAHLLMACIISALFVEMSQAFLLFILYVFFCFLSAYACENYFEGGSWVHVRRVARGATWYSANDDLKGTAMYGTAPFDYTASFSLPFSSWAAERQILFRSGIISSA